MFLMEMDSPGVTVRPLRQMTGETHFNEVFLDDVRVPDANRVGPPGSGWSAVMSTLMAERGLGRLWRQQLGGRSGGPPRGPRPPPRAKRRAGSSARRIAGAHTNAQLRRYLMLRHEAAMQRGAAAGPEGSILKLLFGEQARRCSDLAGRLLGPSLVADTGEWGTYAWSRWVTGTPMMRIAGGTDEIQRNVLAERMLGLPRERPR